MAQANPRSPSGSDGQQLRGILTAPTSDVNCVNCFIFTLTLWENVVALAFIFRGEREYYTPVHV